MKQDRVFPLDRSLNRAVGECRTQKPKQYRHFHTGSPKRAFTADEVREMRRAVERCEVTVRELARRLGKRADWLLLVIDGRNYAWVI